LKNEWTGEASPRTLHSEVLSYLRVRGPQKLWDKWFKILHSNNFLASNYNYKKIFLQQWVFNIFSLLYRNKSCHVFIASKVHKLA